MPWTVLLLQATGAPQHVLLAGQPQEKTADSLDDKALSFNKSKRKEDTYYCVLCTCLRLLRLQSKM